MTLTMRSTRRLYQSNPNGIADGAVSNPLDRQAGTDGQFVTQTEEDRQRIYVAGQFMPAANYVGRILSMNNTPPESGTAGTRKHDKSWFRISEVDPAGNWARLEGFRAEDAGQGVHWTVHASVDFSAASAVFSVDEGPLGPNSAPHPKKRTNPGPTVGQAVFFVGASGELAAQPYFVGALGPAGGDARTSCRLVDWTGRFDTLPAANNLRWELRDMPAYTEEMLWMSVHRFLLECGWELYQLRGANQTNYRAIWRDAIYKSEGEDGRLEGYLRWIAGNYFEVNQQDQSKGLDLSMYAAWDRDYENGANINPGNGVRSCGWTGSDGYKYDRWSSAADTYNHNNRPPYIYKARGLGRSHWGWENTLGTVEGGELSEIHYNFIGDKDEVHLMGEASGLGTFYIGLGFLKPRPEQNGLVFTTTHPAENGAAVTLRVGPDIDPQAPGEGLMPYAVGDRIQVAGKHVNPGIVPAVSHAGEHIVTAQITGFSGLLPAVGTIQPPAGANIAQGDRLTIADGAGQSSTFEFDRGSGVSAGSVLVSFTAADGSGVVASALASAITAAPINITAEVDGSTVRLTSGLSGAAVGDGNLPIGASLSDAERWTIDGMSGAGYGIRVAELLSDMRAGAKLGENPDPLFVYLGRHGSSYPYHKGYVGAFKVTNVAGLNDSSYFSGISPKYNGNQCYGPLETVSDLNEADPNVRGGHFLGVPIVCRSEDQIHGTMRYLRIISPRVRDHCFVSDRQGQYHYVVPTYSQMGTDENNGNSLEANYLFGPFPASNVVLEA